MIKIQHKIFAIFLAFLFFTVISLYFMNLNTVQSANMLTQEATQRQTELLTETDKIFSQSMEQFCFDVTFWDELVTFAHNPQNEWADINIGYPISSYGFSIAWVFDTNFKQLYGFQTLNIDELSKCFINSDSLKNKFSQSWFENFCFEKDGAIFQFYGAPIQPSNDTSRTTDPNGWLLIGRVYEGKLLEGMSRITKSNIKIVFPDKLNDFKRESSVHNAAIYTSIPLKSFNQNVIAYLTSFNVDKATTKYLESTRKTTPVVAVGVLFFFTIVFFLLIIYVVKPIKILNRSLSSEDERVLKPLLPKQNEFGAFSRMMERFFVQKKHLQAEIINRTETEIELKEIQTNLEHLVESRTYELIEANNLMQLERDQAKLYFEMAGALICLLDEDAHILLINKMGSDILGYKVEELIGKNWMDFCFDELTVNACNVKFGSLMNGTQNSCDDYTFSLRTRTNQERKLLINSIVTKNPMNNSKAILFSGLDITNLKRTENELIEAIRRAERANEAQSVFFTNMSHELRTPLFGILGFSEMMASGDFDEEVKKMATTIYKGGKRLIETLNKVLSLSKLEANKLELKLSEVNLNSLIGETVSLFQADAAAKGLNLSFEAPKNEVILSTDSSIVRDIINNLVHNAIKFTFFGQINVELYSNEKSYSISVKDTGIGIPEESSKLIFEEFRQVSEGLSRNFEGTGLGLAITKRYIDLLHGKIELKSIINQGSEFTITLPKVIKEIKNEH